MSKWKPIEVGVTPDENFRPITVGEVAAPATAPQKKGPAPAPQKPAAGEKED